jgi:GAF domain-containing protein
VVDDVENSPVFDEPDRAMVLTAGVRSVVSTPLLDKQGNVRGVVSTHYAQPQRVPSDSAARRVQQQAQDCAQWLSWYDATMMPKVLASVYATAAHVSHDG